MIALRQLLRDLGSQKLRTFLTTFGIVWGTVAITLLLAFGEGLHAQILKTQAGLGNGIVIVWPSRTSIPFEGLGKGRPIQLNEADVAAMRTQSVEAGPLSSEYTNTLRAKIGDRSVAIETAGIHPEFGDFRNLVPQPGGRFIDPIDLERSRRVVFLGDELAKTLFGSENVVGRTLALHGSPFLVIGVMQAKNQDSSYYGRDTDHAFIPATTMRALTGAEYMDNFVFTAKDVSRTKQATAEILSILARRHRFDPKDEEALAVWDTSEFAVFLDTFMLAFRGFLGVVGSLTLVVGAIGVSNVMNVVVEERTREIGIKMALGARPRAVLRQFLLETAVITLTGGAVGLVIAGGICAWFPAAGLTDFVGTPVVSPVVSAVAAALLGAVGFVAGWFPARAASRLDPVVAMKV